MGIIESNRANCDHSSGSDRTECTDISPGDDTAILLLYIRHSPSDKVIVDFSHYFEKS